MFKKWIFGLAALLMGLSAVGAVAAPAFAKTTTIMEAKDKESSETQIVAFKPITLYSGRGGVFFPSPRTSDTMSMSPVDMSMLNKPNGVLVWSGSFNIMAEKSQGITQNSTDVQLPSFSDRGVVFFDLPYGWEQKALKNQDVAIYYLDKGAWKRLATTAVHSSASMPRVGAAFAGEGTYALGIEQPIQP
jgi:hypothetical protein